MTQESMKLERMWKITHLQHQGAEPLLDALMRRALTHPQHGIVIDFLPGPLSHDAHNLARRVARDAHVAAAAFLPGAVGGFVGEGVGDFRPERPAVEKGFGLENEFGIHTCLAKTRTVLVVPPAALKNKFNTAGKYREAEA